MIYHPESLLPRSADLNVTVDVLGGSVPVLETSTRFEGLEILWEKLFGSEGYFPDNHIRGLVNTPEESSEENYKKNPVKRSSDNLIDIESLDQKVSLIKTPELIIIQYIEKKIGPTPFHLGDECPRNCQICRLQRGKS